MRRLVWVVVLAAIVPSVGAVRMEGSLHEPAPLRFGGALLASDVGPGSEAVYNDTGPTAFVRAPVGLKASGQLLLSSPLVAFQLIRSTRSSDLGFGLPEKLRLDPRDVAEFDASDVRLALANASVDFQSLASLRGTMYRVDAPPERGYNASMAECSIASSRGVSRSVVPDEPQRRNQSGEVGQWNPPDALIADCHARRFVAENPGWTIFYGMDLLLASHEGNRLVRTGTFNESSRDGLTSHRVVQWLVARYAGGPIHLDFPFGVTVRMQASLFAGVGHLVSTGAPGRLTWGHLREEGDVSPFDARGAFTFASGPDSDMRIDGRTLEGPELQHAEAPRAAVGRTPAALVWIGAATVGAAALLGVLLHSRLDPPAVLAHERRQRVLEFVKANPGTETHRLVHDLGLARGNLLHHLAVLERAGHLHVRHVGGRTALFPTGFGRPALESRTVLLRRATPRRIVEALRASPGLDQLALARALELSQQAVSKSLKRLVGSDIVRTQAQGRRNQYFVAEVAGAAPASALAQPGCPQTP